MSSLSISSSAIYSSTFSNHIYLSVYFKVGMHQGSVLSPLLFAVAMDIVPSEARSGISSELPYALSPYGTNNGTARNTCS